MIKNNEQKTFIDTILDKYVKMSCEQYIDLLNQYKYIMNIINSGNQPDDYFKITFDKNELIFNWHLYQQHKNTPIFKKILFDDTPELKAKTDVLLQMKRIHISYLIKDIYPDLINKSDELMNLSNSTEDLLVFKNTILKLIESLQCEYYKNIINKNINSVHHSDLNFEQQAVFLINHISNLSGASFSNTWTSSPYSIEDEVGYFYYKRFEKITAIKFKEIIEKNESHSHSLFKKEFELNLKLKSADEVYRRYKNELRWYKKKGLFK